MGAFFLQAWRILRLVSTLQFLHIGIHSLICSTLAAVCGTRLSPKNHATVETGHAWVFPKTVPNFRLLHMALTCALDGPKRTNNYKSDWVGIASLTKHCLTISPKEPKALSGSRAMSLNACWSRPIAVLDGKDRQALRTFAALKSRFLAHS